MSSPFTQGHLKTPKGFEHLLESLCKEILRRQPENILEYANEHFTRLLKLREETGYDGYTPKAEIELATSGDEVVEEPEVETKPEVTEVVEELNQGKEQDVVGEVTQEKEQDVVGEVTQEKEQDVVGEVTPEKEQDVVGEVTQEKEQDVVGEVTQEKEQDVVGEVTQEKEQDVVGEVTPEKEQDVVGEVTQEKEQDVVGGETQNDAPEAEQTTAAPENAAESTEIDKPRTDKDEVADSFPEADATDRVVDEAKAEETPDVHDNEGTADGQASQAEPQNTSGKEKPELPALPDSDDSS